MKSKGATPSISGNNIDGYEIVADIHNHPAEEWDTNGFSYTDIKGKTRDKYLVDCKTDSLLHYDHTTGLVKKYVAGKWYPHATICRTPLPGEDIYITPDCHIDTTALESLCKQQIGFLEKLRDQKAKTTHEQVEHFNWLVKLTRDEFLKIKETIDGLKIADADKNKIRKSLNEKIEPHKKTIISLKNELLSAGIVAGFERENTQQFKSF